MGLEPTRPYGLEILSLVRLPFRQVRLTLAAFSTASGVCKLLTKSQERKMILFQPRLSLAALGAELIDATPKSRTVIEMREMGQFVDDNVVANEGSKKSRKSFPRI